MNDKALARLLAVELLLAEPAALGNDALETDLYILRDQLFDEVRDELLTAYPSQLNGQVPKDSAESA